jgi:HEAT repeat protein
VAKWLLNRPGVYRWSPRSLLNWAFLDYQALRADAVPEAFAVLGTAASPAIPRLEQLRTTHTNADIAWAATVALAGISTNGISGLTSHIADTNSPYREIAALAFSAIPLLRTNVTPAVPMLVACLKEKDDRMHSAAVEVLSDAGAVPAQRALIISALYQAYEDQDPGVQFRVGGLLLSFETFRPRPIETLRPRPGN